MKNSHKLLSILFFANFNFPVLAVSLNLSDFNKLLDEQGKNELRFNKKYENASFDAVAPFLDVVKFEVRNFKYIVHFDGKPKLSCALSNKKTISFVSTLDKGDLIKISAKFSPELFDYQGIILSDCNLGRISGGK